ncbi:hypothetical protein HPB49_019895 [Dermacentor silvarum]|uniref:Uncharacterized protein n=1 Tax=Dermacentor silvarum TaxID=543639 RepID=A0ACB8DKS6_DERSI|nr:hypothetical protein HPB49_019895 [Dermacentor silvarum]
MSLAHHSGRREARAKAYNRLLAGQKGIIFTDASQDRRKSWVTVTVTSTEKLLTGAITGRDARLFRIPGACRSALELLPACGDVAGPGRRLLTRLNILEMEAYSFLQFAAKQFKDDLKMLERAAYVAHHVLLMPSLHDSRKQKNAGALCWMETEAGELNKFLNPFGVVLYEMREGSLDFTMTHNDPVTPCDPKAVVLFLATCWLLREHRCFSGISLNVSVVERFRPGQFQQHITFAKQFVTFHLIDVEGIKLSFTMCPLVLALDQTELLAHVTLDRILDMEVYRFLHFTEKQLKDEPEFLDRAAHVAHDVLKLPSLLDSCTQQNEGGARCRMVTEAEELNKFLKPFGVKFNELREGNLDLTMTHNDPVAPCDLKAVLLCLATLWFLREHRCFSGVRLNVLVLERFRPGQLLQHITFAKWVVPVHLIGVEGIELPFTMCSLILEMEAYCILQFTEKQFKEDLGMLERAAYVAHHVLLMPSLHDSGKQQNAGAHCWMETKAGELNKFLNTMGMELHELREGSLDFTMTHNDPVTPCDPKAVVLFLATCWFLREHRCFSGISLNVSVVERFRPGQFQQHITFAKQVVTFHLIDVKGIELLFTMCPLVLALDQTKLLAHVTIDRGELNKFLNTLGMELYELREGSLDFTMTHNDPVTPCDPKAVVLFLATCWFLREHRCFSVISLNVSMVERFRPGQFQQHITFAKQVVTFHLIDVKGIELLFTMCPLVMALDQTKLLAHVTLDRILDLEAYRFLHFAENQLKDEPEFLDRAPDVARDVLEMPSLLDSCTQQNEGGARCWMVTEAVTHSVT